MIDEQKLARYRHELSRMFSNPEEAVIYTQVLANTNWHEVFMLDVSTCNHCDTSTPCFQLTWIGPEYRCCPTCLENMKNGFERICIQCNCPFLSYHYFDHFRCLSCRTKERIEYKKVATHVGRTRQLQLPATLTLKQWLETVDNFQWTCAYCRVRPYENLDHFVPITKGGGTTQSNCVPACIECNKLKDRHHPDTITSIPQEDLERVRSYLNHFK